MNDFREYKGYCEYTYGDVMHSRGDRGKLSHSGINYQGYDKAADAANQSKEQRRRKETAMLKRWAEKIPGTDWDYLYNNISMADWRKAVEYAIDNNSLGVQSVFNKYFYGKPVTVTGTSLSSQIEYKKRRRK